MSYLSRMQQSRFGEDPPMHFADYYYIDSNGKPQMPPKIPRITGFDVSTKYTVHSEPYPRLSYTSVPCRDRSAHSDVDSVVASTFVDSGYFGDVEVSSKAETDWSEFIYCPDKFASPPQLTNTTQEQKSSCEVDEQNELPAVGKSQKWQTLGDTSLLGAVDSPKSPRIGAVF